MPIVRDACIVYSKVISSILRGNEYPDLEYIAIQMVWRATLMFRGICQNPILMSHITLPKQMCS